MDNKRLRELAGTYTPTEVEKIFEAKKEEKQLDEGMFGPAGYGGEKDGGQQVVSELAQMLRDIKMFLRDGNMEDATMMVDRAYKRAAGSARG